jgi:hypothetical protein
VEEQVKDGIIPEADLTCLGIEAMSMEVDFVAEIEGDVSPEKVRRKIATKIGTLATLRINDEEKRFHGMLKRVCRVFEKYFFTFWRKFAFAQEQKIPE